MEPKTKVFAIAAHPDDIEFCMAGTLFLLAKAGCDIHYMNIANGSCGSAVHDVETIVAVRMEEAQRAAAHLKAWFHPPLVPDLEIFYEKSLLARMGSIIRSVAPDILLVPSPQDYMEDHVNAGRLAATAVFCRAIPNFPVVPPHAPVKNEVAVYHAQPYGNRDMLNELTRPHFFVDIGSVIEEKTSMLAEHRSQKDWLDHSQGIGTYLEAMRSQAREMGALSGRCEYAEGWRRHNPLGFSSADFDPLLDILKIFILKE